jgi:hypothetical protein
MAWRSRLAPTTITPARAPLAREIRHWELERLNSLQSLNLTNWWDLSGDLSPLARLTSLQSLNLEGCEQLSDDLSPLANRTSLQSLNLSYCRRIRRFALLESMLPTLKDLRLFGCKLDDLPPEVCGESALVSVSFLGDTPSRGRPSSIGSLKSEYLGEDIDHQALTPA